MVLRGKKNRPPSRPGKSLVLREHLRWLRFSLRRGGKKARFEVDSFKDLFNPAFDFFNEQVKLRKNNFFVSRGELRLKNTKEIESFKAEVVDAFADELWLKFELVKKNHRPAFLEGALIYAEYIKEIGKRKESKVLRDLGPNRAFQAEIVQTAKIVSETFAFVGLALKTEIIDELERMQEKKKKRKKRK